MGTMFSTQNSEPRELTRRNVFMKRVVWMFAVSTVVENPGSTTPPRGKAPDPGALFRVLADKLSGLGVLPPLPAPLG